MGSFEQEQDRSIQGVVTGIVKKNWDKDHPGMVQVEINLAEETFTTDWVRVALPYAGNGYGAYWLPEVGSEVLLAFQRGDLNHPYVIGSLWGGDNGIPSQTANADNTVKRIKTKGGHEIVFSDETDKERLEIHTPKNLRVTLEDETQTIVVQDKNGKNMLKISGKDGGVEITAENEISFNSAGGGAVLSLNGAGKHAVLKADMISLDSPQHIEIKGQGTLKLTGGMVELQGALVKIN